MSDVLTEDTARGLEAGPVLDALCAVATGSELYPDLAWLVSALSVDYQSSTKQEYSVARSWSAAGPALEWLGEHGGVDLSLDRDDDPDCELKVWLEAGVNREADIYVDTRSIPLAIARAVVLVGLRERPDEMQAAWQEFTR